MGEGVAAAHGYAVRFEGVGNEHPERGAPGQIAVPEVLLVGASGSGRSTLARRTFRPAELVLSKACSGLVADGENDQVATPDALALAQARARLPQTYADGREAKAGIAAWLTFYVQSHGGCVGADPQSQLMCVENGPRLCVGYDSTARCCTYGSDAAARMLAASERRGGAERAANLAYYPCGNQKMTARIARNEFRGSRDDSVPVEPGVIAISLWPRP